MTVESLIKLGIYENQEFYGTLEWQLEVINSISSLSPNYALANEAISIFISGKY